MEKLEIGEYGLGIVNDALDIGKEIICVTYNCQGESLLSKILRGEGAIAI